VVELMCPVSAISGRNAGSSSSSSCRACRCATVHQDLEGAVVGAHEVDVSTGSDRWDRARRAADLGNLGQRRPDPPGRRGVVVGATATVLAGPLAKPLAASRCLCGRPFDGDGAEGVGGAFLQHRSAVPTFMVTTSIDWFGLGRELGKVIETQWNSGSDCSVWAGCAAGPRR
jgi:hypothetical protein